MAKDVVYIYGLADPNTLRIRYVGKSNNPKERLTGHLSERSLHTKNEKNAWLRSLLEQGLRPVLIILQEITHGCWAEAERAWICILRMQGCKLTNTSDGGEGILDQDPQFSQPHRPAVTVPKPPPPPRVGGLIPRRPRPVTPKAPKPGDKYSPQDKYGCDRPTRPRPPRKPRAKGKPRKKPGTG